MASNEFRIVTRWEVRGDIARIARILSQPERFPDWWGKVYLATEIVDRGNADGVGSRVKVHSKGWLPYEIHWIGTLTAQNRPHGWSVRAEGDLNGQGEWHLTQHGPMAEVVYDWRVTADRPLFRILSPVLKPVFAWNHRWAMAQGLEGLKRELAREEQTPASDRFDKESSPG